MSKTSAKITCIAVDDEPAALKIIEEFARKTPQLSLIKTFRSSLEAMSFINSTPIQLIFLDINMPDLSGIEFMKSLSTFPLVVLTTAYSEYAVESYDYETIDYLLKPIAFPRFLKSVNKAVRSLNPLENKPMPEYVSGILLLKDGANTYPVKANTIIYLQSMGNYVKVFTDHKTIILKSGLQEFLNEHQVNTLCRIHKSFAVNIKKVTKITYSSLYLDDTELPIGRKYRETLGNWDW